MTEQAAAAAATAMKDASAKKAALQKEIDNAMADGVITKKEQKASHSAIPRPLRACSKYDMLC